MPSLSPRADHWVQAGVPEPLARRVDAAEGLFFALDVAEIAEAAQRPLAETAAVHAGIGERVGLERLRQQVELLPADSYWQGLAKLALADDLADLQRSLARAAATQQGGPPAQVLAHWEAGNRQGLERAQRLLAELREAPGGGDLAMLSVALRELRNLV